MKYNLILAASLAAAIFLSGCSGQQTQQPEPPAQSIPADLSTAPASQPEPAVSELPEQPERLEGEPSTQPEVLLAAVEQADWSWFDDVVMIGDSVSLKLKNFVVKARQTDEGYFGGGQFLTSGSLGSGNALWEVSDKSVHPSFQGSKMLLEESIPLTGAKKVYLMLGVNDIAVYGIDGAIENYGQLLDQIQAAAPDVQFYLQSATPICEGAEAGALTNENLEIYNEKLKEMCLAREIPFVDVAAVLRDETGYLPREYCSDPDGMGIHLTDLACQLWLGYLLEDAKYL